MLITLDPEDSFHEAIARDAVAAGVRDLPVRVSSSEELMGRLDEGLVPGALLLGPRVGVDSATEIAREVLARLPDTIVLMVAMPTTTTLRAALRAGVRDVLRPGHSAEDLAEALAAAGYSEQRGQGELGGQTIAVFSSKGGVGTSTLASNLAHRLSALSGVSTILADFDLASSDQAILHGVRPTWTMQDVADGSIGDDIDALEQVLVPLADSRVSLLAGPVDPAAAETIGEGPVSTTLHRLRQLAPLVVVDTSCAFTDATIATLEYADTIVLVTSLDVLALRSLSVTLQTLDRLGIDRDRVRLVVMRSDAKVGLTLDDVARTTGASVDVAIPSSRDVPRSINTATPLAREMTRSQVIRSVDELVQQLMDGVAIEGAAEISLKRPRFVRRRGPDPVAEPSDGREASVPPVVAAPPAPVAAVPEAADDPAEAEPFPRPVRRRVTRQPAPPPAPDTSDADEEPEHVAAVVELSDTAQRLASMPPPSLGPAASSSGEPTKRRSIRRHGRN